MKRILPLTAAGLLFAALLIYPDTAVSAAYKGMKICTELILPSLFPFFAATKLISSLGLAGNIGKGTSAVFQRLFSVSGKGASAFVIGISAGYPMGAAYISDLYKSGDIGEHEAQKLLVFCNNSGPAFIIGAVGSGVFSSSAVGILLYAVHILSALLGGIIFSDSSSICTASSGKTRESLPFSIAATNAIKASVETCLNICGFIIAFSVLIELFDSFGIFSQISGLISSALNTPLHWSRALLCGFIELGNGIACMEGLDASPLNLALAAFILGFGGLSVQLQTFSVLQGLNIKTARYLIGRLIIAVIAGALACLAGAVLF